MPKTREEAKALLKGLRVLEALAGGQRELSLAELAKGLKLRKTTAHRIVKVLKARGYLDQDATTNAYRLGLKVWQLGHYVVHQRRLREVARPFIEALARKTEEHVNLAVLDQNEAIFIEIIESPKPIRPYTYLGGRVPAYCSATGKAILAWQPEEIIAEVIRRGLKPFTDRTIVTAARLREELRVVRVQGYALNREEWREDVCGIAAPVRNHEAKVVASVSITTPASRFDESVLRHVVVTTALGISSELGWIRSTATRPRPRRPGHDGGTTPVARGGERAHRPRGRRQ